MPETQTATLPDAVRVTGTVHIVDDDDSFRTAVSRLLRASGYEVRDYESPSHFFARRDARPPECLLLDVQMPGRSGLELQKTLAVRGQSIPIVFVTGHGDIPMSVRAMKAGAIDFLTKPIHRDTLLAAVETALARDSRADVDRGSGLTDRELDVLTLLCDRLSNKEIGRRLFISAETVKKHTQHIYKKLDVSGRREAVRVAIACGIRLPEKP